MNRYGIIKIATTFSQTVIVATDALNHIIAWTSIGFEHKNVSSLSYNAIQELAIKIKRLGMENVDIIVKGYGLGRELAIKALIDNGITINLIKDKTPIPHNGCFPMERKRKNYKFKF